MAWALAAILSIALGPGLGADLGVEVDPLADDGDLLEADVHTPVTDVALDVPAPPLSAPLGLPGLSAGQDPASGRQAPATSARDADADGALGALVPETPAGRATAGASLLAVLTAVGWAALRALGLTPLLPFFSRIEDGELAEHPARRAALDYVHANPGATVSDVQGALGLAWGTTVHHLRRLERAGLVAVRRDGGRRGHWPLGQAPPRDGLSAADRAMAGLVKASPGLPQKDLARLSGVGAPAACKRLARLEDAGLVAQVHDGRARLYMPTGKLLALDVPAPVAPVTPMPMAVPMLAAARVAA